MKALPTENKRCAGDGIRNDAPNVCQNGDDDHYPPCNSRIFRLVGEFSKESQKTAFDSPQDAPEQDGVGELELQVEGRVLHEICSWRLESVAGLEDIEHWRYHELNDNAVADQKRQCQEAEVVIAG